MMRRALKERGFTLIEVIVVIVLFSLITTLSIQGIGYVLGQRARMAQFQQEITATTLRHQWFVDVIEGLAIPPENKDYKFIGKERELRGFSLAPLIKPESPGVFIAWSISLEEGRNTLNYYQFSGAGDNGAQLAEIGVLKGVDGEAYFRYLDEDGVFHREWPPATRLMKAGKVHTLPDAIAVFMGRGYKVSWVARVKNAKNVKMVERFTE